MDLQKVTATFAKLPKGITQGVLVVALVGAAFLIGSLKTKVDFYEKGGQPAGTTTTQAQQQQAPAQPTVSIDQIKNLFKQNVIKFGDSSKKVIFVEVGDPSCPYCHIAGGKDGELNAQVGDRFKLVADGGTYVAPVPEMKKLLDQGKAAFMYIYDPGHGNGQMGMKALLCANEKGKFWEVHDLMMSEKGYEIQNGVDVKQNPTTGPVVKNDKTKSGDLANFLKSVVDPNDMKSCLDSGKYDTRLDDDTKLAVSLGVQGTPGFFVNATAFNGAYSYKDMEPAVTAALK